MSDLQLFNQSALPTTSNNYVTALASRKLFELTDNEKWNLLLDSIGVATFLGGWHAKSNEDIVMTINALLQDINGRFRGMTEGEVKAAFEKGAKGYYGDTPGISPAGCIKWLTCYYGDVNRQNAKAELQKLADQPAPRPEQTQEDRRQFMNAAYQSFCKNGFYTDYGNLIYDMLDKEGVITFSNERKREFLERGRKILHDKLTNYKTLQEKRENDRKIDELMTDDKAPVAEAKRIALYEYFSILRRASYKEIPFNETCLKFDKAA